MSQFTNLRNFDRLNKANHLLKQHAINILLQFLLYCSKYCTDPQVFKGRTVWRREMKYTQWNTIKHIFISPLFLYRSQRERILTSLFLFREMANVIESVLLSNRGSQITANMCCVKTSVVDSRQRLIFEAQMAEWLPPPKGCPKWKTDL